MELFTYLLYRNVLLSMETHWVDATAGGDLFPRGYHQPSSQHFCFDLSYHWYFYNYKLTVNKTSNF